MATVTNTQSGTSLTGALSATAVLNDDVILNQGGEDYVSDLGGLSGTTLTSFRSVRPRTGSIGSAGASAAIDAATVEIADLGRLHNIAGVATKTITELIYDAPNGQLNLDDATVTDLAVRSGKAVLNDGVACTDLFTSADVEARSGGTGLTNAYCFGRVPAVVRGKQLQTAGSRLLLERDCDNVYVEAGATVVIDSADFNGTIHLRGGRVELKETGTIAAINGWGIVAAHELTVSVTVSGYGLTGQFVLVKPQSAFYTITEPSAGQLVPPKVMEYGEALDLGVI